MLVTRSGTSKVLAPDLTGNRLAIVGHFLPRYAIIANYPRLRYGFTHRRKAILARWRSIRRMLIWEMPSDTHYLVGKYFLNEVYLTMLSGVLDQLPRGRAYWHGQAIYKQENTGVISSFWSALEYDLRAYLSS
ncbi:hypothetical protein [Pseudomonas mucidolens]|uniref:hypothetical protein n=1 Tax=Pseudomonas mucidolens TaxID=46679 RepID=UPI0009FC1026|nr:hypothetical protein [Pseudomonas mucidolens]SQH32568.1 Uncharacterised protein [Pseudomonas mucidolens]